MLTFMYGMIAGAILICMLAVVVVTEPPCTPQHELTHARHPW